MSVLVAVCKTRSASPFQWPDFFFKGLIIDSLNRKDRVKYFCC